MTRVSAYLLALLTFCLPLQAQEVDSLHAKLDSTVFAVEKPSSGLSFGVSQATTATIQQIKKVPMLMGNADPLRFVRLLPGVTSGMDLDSGLHIQGTENAHCLVAVEGVPVYGASHLLGMFSSFISSHFKEMEFTPFSAKANRLGGTVNMRLPSEVPSRFRGQITAGLFESEGTLDIPLGKRSGLFLSARKSYINLLYAPFLRMDEYSFRYGMGDGNLTWYWTPRRQDQIWADVSLGADAVTFLSSISGINFSFDWWNRTAALHWLHTWDGGPKLKQTFYHSGLALNIDFKHDFFNFIVPSSIATTGYKASLESGRWRFEAHAAYHQAMPQKMSIGNIAFDLQPEGEHQQGVELTAEAHYTWPVNQILTLEGALKGVWWLSPDGASYPALLPEARALLNLGWAGKLDAVAGLARQHLFQTGVSSMGMPTEFWYLAGKDLPPQGSAYTALTWGRNFFREQYSVQISAYYRHLTNQIDYNGNMLDYLQADYATPRYLSWGSGSNYGLGIILQRQYGALTGWISYTLSRSLRNFEGGSFPASHERIHEFNAVANYSLGAWDFGASMVLASGTPFTAAEAFYVLGGTLITSYSERNASRAKPYFRLDIQASYYFHRGERENGISFSMFNAAGYKNDIYRQLTVTEDGKFAYKPFGLHLRFLPALSYFHHF